MILDTLTPTALGNALIANALAQGGKIAFTRCAVGAGDSGGDIEGMTSIAEEVGEYTIEAVIASDTSAVIVVKEVPFETAYYLREMGLFAKLGEGSEILFAAAREADNPEYIQPGGNALRDVSYTIQFDISGAKNVVVQIASVRYVRESQKGAPWGIPTLDENAQIPVSQIPVLPYIPSNSRGEANGVATLDEQALVPKSQIPALPYIPDKEKGAASGIAPLDANKRIPTEYFPKKTWESKSVLASEYAVDSDTSAYVAAAEIPYAMARIMVVVGNGTIDGVYDKENARVIGRAVYKITADGVLYGEAGALTATTFDFTQLGYASDTVLVEITKEGVRVTANDKYKTRAFTVYYMEM